MRSDWRNRYEVAVEAAQAAGQLALRYFDTGLEVEWKHDRSPVTLADREAEHLLRSRLLETFPGDGFLGEESGNSPGSSGFRWIIDPIDGTRSFVRGVPLWATLVGLEHHGEPIAGVVVAPALGHTYRALRGEGAWRNDRRLHTSSVDTLDRAHLFYSSISWFRKAGREQTLLHLASLTERQRGYGDFYGFVLVAQGSGEIMFEHGCHAWDLGALVPLIEEAGGRMTNWAGVRDINSPDVIATNGKLHQRVLEILKD